MRAPNELWRPCLMVALWCSTVVGAAPIVFEGVDRGVYAINLGSDEITTIDATGRGPSLSPDGQTVLLVGDDGILCEVPLDGSSRRSLGLSGREPCWSLDAAKIAFLQRSTLLVADSDGQGIIEVAPTANRMSWSPVDRDVLYYSFSYEGDGNSIAKVDVATGDTATVIRGSYIPDMAYALSPAGDALLVLRARGGYEMSVLLLMTGDLYSVGPFGPNGPQSAAWSPSGDRIAYDLRSGTEGLFVCDSNGAGATLVVPGAYKTAPYAPAWSPDGSMIAFHMRNFNGGPDRVHVVNADGTDMRLLAIGRYPQWCPMPRAARDPNGNTGVRSLTWGEVKRQASKTSR